MTYYEKFIKVAEALEEVQSDDKTIYNSDLDRYLSVLIKVFYEMADKEQEV